MTSKEQILSRIRSQKLPDATLPSLNEAWIRYPDRETQFIDVLKSVGGQARVISQPSLGAAIAELDCWRAAQKTVSFVGDIAGNIDLGSIAAPHQLADVDVAVVPGELAVAENGAIWVEGAQLVHRAILFICRHLVLVVSRETLLDNMHEAYERIQFSSTGYGVFVSGPSKTADIEQSLVIGAHGPRSLTAFLVGE